MNIQQNAAKANSAKSWEAVRSVSRAPLSPLAEDIDRLVDNGYGAMLRPCAPPGIDRTFLHKATGKPKTEKSDGKVPTRFHNGKWIGMRGWRTSTPSAADFEEWRRYPAAGLCVVTGEIGAFDIDIKISAEASGSEADHGRELVAEIERLIAATLGVPIEQFARRWRDNSTSRVVFVRLAEKIGKRKLQFVGGHALEFLATGQQVVVSGMHLSGARVRSSLTNIALSDLPILEEAKLNDLIPAIAAAADKLGFGSAAASASGRNGAAPKPPYSPATAVLREVMARRADWASMVVPCIPGTHHEWRVSSAELDRQLDEDLSIYADGILDCGTERGHNPLSLIAEFGAIDEAGGISFGGSPEYGPADGQPFAVVGESDPKIKRPTKAEAATWLCRTLSGHQDFPAFPEGTTWKSAQVEMARSVGLEFRKLTDAKWYEHSNDNSPINWNTSTATANAGYLSALKAVDPDVFDRLAFALDMNGVDAAAIVAARRCAVAAGETDVLQAAPAPIEAPDGRETEVGGDYPEPFDIFAHDDVANLGTLPRNCLPPMLHRWVISESRRKGAPESFAAASAISVAAAAVGASRRIQVRANDPDFVQPASLWFAIIADPGSGKSPTIAAALKPLRSIDDEWYVSDKRVHDHWSAQSPKRKDAPDRGPEPAIRRLIVDDVTIERQTQIHAQNPRGIIRSPDELVAFLGSFGAYKKNGDADRGQALRLFDGGPIKVDRVSSGAAGVYAKNGLMGVIAGTQPEKMRQKVRELGGDGMLQRLGAPTAIQNVRATRCCRWPRDHVCAGLRAHNWNASGPRTDRSFTAH